MPVPALEIVRATEADIPFIMATERLPANEGLVGRWAAGEHRQGLADGGNAYFVGLVEGAQVGFVIVQRWASVDGAALIRRIIVAEPGKGVGRALLSKVLDAIFSETDASRVWLNVFPHNERAQKSYAALGFRFEDRAKLPVAGESKSLLMVLRRSDRMAPG